MSDDLAALAALCAKEWRRTANAIEAAGQIPGMSQETRVIAWTGLRARAALFDAWPTMTARDLEDLALNDVLALRMFPAAPQLPPAADQYVNTLAAATRTNPGTVNP